MKAPIWGLTAVWAVLTAIGVWLAVTIELLPSPGSKEAHIIDHATELLTALAVPIFMGVMVVLVYCVFKFRSNGDPTQDGAPIAENKPLQWVWVLTSLGLVLYLTWYGAVGLIELRGHGGHSAAAAPNELVIDVTARQFAWEFNYRAEGVKTMQELVLPVNQPVRINLTANDVIHSFWVPAFRVKIDAVPGLTTNVLITPDRLAPDASDVNYRVQCTELCGGGHGVMSVPVKVLDKAGFDAWVSRIKTSR